MKNKSVGILIGALLLIGVIVVGFILKNNSDKEVKTSKNDSIETTLLELNGLLASEKVDLFEDEEFKKIAKEKYGVVIRYSKSGSIDMATRKLDNLDYVFPSSSVAKELFENKNGDKVAKTETVLNSPIVLFSWNEVATALEKEGIIKRENDMYYADTLKLISIINEGKKWSDIGLNDLYGNVKVISTHPSKSNSWNMFAALVANTLNNGEIVTDSSLPKVLPDVQKFYKNLGYLEESSSDLFEQYLRTGMGAKPIIVGYENQLIEFVQQNPQVWEQVKDKMKIVYLTPTVWSEHPVIALNDNGKKLIEVLSDPEIQEIAWKKHGFRTGLSGIENNPKDLSIHGIPETIRSVMPMPTPNSMETIVDTLNQ